MNTSGVEELLRLRHQVLEAPRGGLKVIIIDTGPAQLVQLKPLFLSVCGKSVPGPPKYPKS